MRGGKCLGLQPDQRGRQACLERQLECCNGVHFLAFEPYGQALPAAHGSGVGVRLSGRNVRVLAFGLAFIGLSKPDDDTGTRSGENITALVHFGLIVMFLLLLFDFIRLLV